MTRLAAGLLALAGFGLSLYALQNVAGSTAAKGMLLYACFCALAAPVVLLRWS